MRVIRMLTLIGLLSSACGPGGEKAAEEPKTDDIGAQAANVVSDTDALRAANEAAGEVVRSAGDCESVKAALPEAKRRLDEIEPSVRTAAGKVTFEAVRKRVRDVAEVCP